MVAHDKTEAFLGVEAVAVDVQVQLAPGHRAFTVVGLPDKSVSESLERLRAALLAMGPTHKRVASIVAMGEPALDGARTLADLDHRDIPGVKNVATAIRWRDIAF